MGIACDIGDGACLLEQHAPAGCGRFDAKSQVGHGRLAHDGARNAESDRNDQVTHKAGNQVFPDDLPGGYAGKSCRHDIILILQGQEFSADYPGHSGPVDKGENDGYVKIHLYGGDSRRNCRREGHPERNLRNGSDDLDDSLDHDVNGSSEITGDGTDGNAQEEADDGAGKRDGQGDTASQKYPGEDIPSQRVRSEKHDLRAASAIASLAHTEEVDVAGNQSQDLIFRAVYEETQLIIFRCVLRDGHGKVRLVNGLLQLVDMRSHKLALIGPVNRGGSAVLVQGIKLVQRVGRQEIRKQSAHIEDQQDEHGEFCKLMLFQLSAHQGPLGSKIIIIVGFLFLFPHYLPPPE